jgi:hypothetical protein
MPTARRTVIIITIILAALGTAAAPASAGQVVKEPGFVSANASCDGTAHALISHYVGNVGTITSAYATRGPGVVSNLMTGWAHAHGDQITCVGPE